jgi:hypothetical protein
VAGPSLALRANSSEFAVPVAVCPHCRAELDLDAEDVGALVECPACQTGFTPPLPIARPVRPEERALRPWGRSGARTDRQRGEHEDSSAGMIRHAKALCSTEGGLLMASGAMSLMSGLGSATGGALVGKPAFGIPPEWMPFVYVGYGIFLVAIGAFQIYAGRQMQQVKQHGLCVLGCVLAVVGVVGPLGFLGLAFGLMGVSKLNDRRVKLGFAANRPDFDPDAGV